jgi:hypothetical protein
MNTLFAHKTMTLCIVFINAWMLQQSVDAMTAVTTTTSTFRRRLQTNTNTNPNTDPNTNQNTAPHNAALDYVYNNPNWVAALVIGVVLGSLSCLFLMYVYGLMVKERMDTEREPGPEHTGHRHPQPYHYVNEPQYGQSSSAASYSKNVQYDPKTPQASAPPPATSTGGTYAPPGPIISTSQTPSVLPPGTAVMTTTVTNEGTTTATTNV